VKLEPPNIMHRYIVVYSTVDRSKLWRPWGISHVSYPADSRMWSGACRTAAQIHPTVRNFDTL